MIPLLAALQATAVEPLPDDAPARATQIGQAAADAAPAAAHNGLDMVQLVLLLLLFASIASWVIIFRKKRVLDRAEREAMRFEERFWSGAELSKLYAGATERNREFLANVGSISPYVGLVGTVWGIMISFQGLANMKEATIATVAPGISEALVATAMGLFAAIPAVWAYNRFATKVERLNVRYEAFAEDFSSILQRQAHVDDA